MTKRFRSFDEFWPFYLREHGHSETRTLHIAGTTIGLACLLRALAAVPGAADRDGRHSGPVPWLVAAAVAGYGPAWVSHFFLEGNRPATFEHPLWSLLGDLRMSWLWATGGLDPELRTAGIGRNPAIAGGRDVRRHAGR
jgi:hypothetical protein